MTEPASCPFCNALLLAPRLEGGRAVCPRCGEPLPETVSVHLASQASARGTDAAPAPERGPSNRRLALIVLALMACMAALSLVYALRTTDFRRSNDRKKSDRADPVVLRSPLELSGLDYLPLHCDVLAGIHVAQLLQHKEARKWLQSPRGMFFDWTVGQVERWTTLKAQDLDEITVGIVLSGETPWAVLVAQTKLAHALQIGMKEKGSVARPSQWQHRGRPVFRAPLDTVGERALWCAGDKTLVFVLKADKVEDEDLLQIPEPTPKTSARSETLDEIMGRRLRGPQLLWVAADLSKLATPVPVLTFLPARESNLLSKIEAFGLGLSHQEEPALMGHFKLKKTSDVRAVTEYLESFTSETILANRVEVPPPQAKLPDALWLTWQLRAMTSALPKLFEQRH